MKSENQLVSINPTTGQQFGSLDVISQEQLDIIISKAHSKSDEWAKTSISERIKYLQKLSDVILEEKNEIAKLVAEEQGKPVGEALGAEVLAVLAILKDLIKNAKKILAKDKVPHEQILFVHKKSHYNYVPFGVVAIISPWNYPFSVPIPEIAAALVAGNTVIFKPAPQTIFVGKCIDELFKKAGFPEYVVNTVFVTDHVAPFITTHPDVRKIVFTGSTEVGKKIMKAASDHLKPVVLELGGKDAAVVAGDANLQRAAKGIVWGAFFSTGQVCASVERVYVVKEVAEQFLELCVKETGLLKVGNPLEPDTDMGPLSTAEQMENFQAHIQDAVEKGAKVLVGGKKIPGPGFFFEPTVLSHADHSMKIMTHETFGPALPIMIVDSLDEAIRMANDCDFGLSAFGWTQSRKTAQRLMNELQAGTVLINDSTVTWGEPNAPWAV